LKGEYSRISQKLPHLPSVAYASRKLQEQMKKSVRKLQMENCRWTCSAQLAKDGLAGKANDSRDLASLGLPQLGVRFGAERSRSSEEVGRGTLAETDARGHDLLGGQEMPPTVVC
jgi:hypothetical protein